MQNPYVVYNIEYISKKDAFIAVAQKPSDSRTTTVIKKRGTMEIVHKMTTSFTTQGTGIEIVNVDLDEQGVEAAISRLIEHEKNL